MDYRTTSGIVVPDRAWAWRFAAILVISLVTLYAVTRSTVLPGDVLRFVQEAAKGDKDAPQLANPGHVLQVPLARGVWLGLAHLGVAASMEHVMAAIAMISTACAAVFIGWIALALVGTRAAAWTAAVLYGLSLHSGVMSNGEQYGLPIAICAAGIWLALSGIALWPGVLFGVSMMGHAEFFFAAPALCVATWYGRADLDARARVWRACRECVTGAAVTGVGTLALTYYLKKWTGPASLMAWIVGHLRTDHQYTVSVPEPFRALKGLATALTFGGHVWRDALTGRGSVTELSFLLQMIAGLILLTAIVGGVWMARRDRRLLVLAGVWLLPFHVGGNWWIESTVEKYHGGALPALVLLVTGGWCVWMARWTPERQRLTLAGLVCVSGLLNYTGAVWPIRDLGIRRAAAAAALDALPGGTSGRRAIASCDLTPAVDASRTDVLRIRSYWTGTVPQIQDAIQVWVDARLREGSAVYLYGSTCYPEEWITDWSKDRFDMLFLRRAFQVSDPLVRDAPQHETVATNPRSWKRADVRRVTSREGARP